MVKRPLRVLHVLEATLGGTRRYLQDILVAMRDVSLAQGLVYGTSRADPGFFDLLRQARQAGWHLFPADSMRRPVRPLADAQSVSTVVHAIQDFKPSLLHAHSAKAGAVGRIAALTRWPHVPLVLYSPHALPSRLGGAYMLAERALAPLAKRFVAVSDSERAEIVSSGIADFKNVDVVYPRIDTESFAPQNQCAARQSLNLPDVPIVIGIGRLADQKNPLAFVRMLARVRYAHPETIGIWVGDGELRASVEGLAGRVGLGDAFRIAGWRTDVRPYIAAADLLVSTSQYESFGYVIPETFAMERPVVASRVMGTVDVFFSAAAHLLYEPDDIDEGAALVTKLIDDKAHSSELGRLGRISVTEKFSTVAMRTALSASYDTALI